MKTYFIVESDASGHTFGKTTQNLGKLLSDLNIVWSEEWEDGDKFGLKKPKIIIESIPSYGIVQVFELTDKLGIQQMIAEFNFYTGLGKEDLSQFISDFYREIASSDESNVKKFIDFNRLI